MFEPVVLLTCCVLFGVAVVFDLASRCIPDSVPLALLALFAVYALVGDHIAPLWTHIVTGAVLLAAGFGLFTIGALGGGDGKLMAVAGLWIGPFDISAFLAGVGLLGLGLALFSLLPFDATRRLRPNLPFAVAIAPPAIVLLVLQAFSA